MYYLTTIILAVTLAPAAGLAWLALGRQKRRAQATRHYLAALAQATPRELWPDEQGTWCPPPSAGDPWLKVLAEVHTAFRQRARTIQDLEQARAAGEIRAGRALAEAEHVRGILAGLPQPILLVDGYGEPALANHSAEELFPADPGHPEAGPLARLARCQKLVELLLGATRHSGAGRSEEIEIPDGEGKARCYRVDIARLAAGAVAVLQDIADRKTLQKRHAEFVSNVSHEMKTPLSGIKAYVELLRDGDAEDEAAREEFLAVIDGQADRMQRLVENLLNLARIEAGVVRVSKQPLSLNAVLEEALGVVRPSAQAKTIDLRGELSPLYLGVLADHDLLLQAAINLLSNAVKYTPAGGRVALRSRLEAGQVRFEVEDTGVGLSPEDCGRVFEKFYRVQKSRDMAGGTGLGLPLAKHIVEDVHGGRLGLESTLGQGSTFHVTLPAAGQMS